MSESTTEAPKRKAKQTRRQPQIFIIEEVYPDGMTKEEYWLELRKHARHFARLFLQIYPNVLIQDEEQNEKVVTPSRL